MLTISKPRQSTHLSKAPGRPQVSPCNRVAPTAHPSLVLKCPIQTGGDVHLSGSNRRGRALSLAPNVALHYVGSGCSREGTQA